MKNILKIACFAAIFSACGTASKPGTVTETEKRNLAPEEAVGIQLNAGRKWHVNNEMMTHVQNMEKDIFSFKGQSLRQYRELAERIKNHIGELTSSCTITGPSHEELHKWLHPFIELNEKFGKSESIAEASKYYEEIKKQMEVFHRYFV